jgi:hypothetical protein
MVTILWYNCFSISEKSIGISELLCSPREESRLIFILSERMENIMKSLKNALFLNLITASIVIFFACNVWGDTLCYDNFSGNSSGWTNGSSWDGNLTVSVNSSVTPLVYSNEFVFVNGGDTAISITTDVGGSSSRYLSRGISEQTNTFYISFLARYHTGSLSTWDYLGCGQKADGADTGAALGHAGISSCAGAAYIDDETTEELGNANPQANTTYLIVAKYTWDVSKEAFTNLTAYLNPLSATNESAEASATVSGTVKNPFSSIDFQYYGSVDADFDEIRIGRTWADVVPAAPPVQEPTTYSVTVTLTPPEAIAAGAKWGIEENSVTNWHDSGTNVQLTAGEHHIVYSSSFQSRSPDAETITITQGENLSLTRSYNQTQPVLWQQSSLPAVDISGVGDAQSATNNNGLLGSYFGVYPELQSVEEARLNSSISISSSADLIGSLDRADRPQDQTWVFNWSTLKPTQHTNTANWGESDWIGLHTPSVGFDFSGAYAPGGDVDPYSSKTDHTAPDGSDTQNDYYPSGGELYDLEAMYFDNDKDYFYISFVSSAPFSNKWINADGTLCHDLSIPETASSRTNSVVIPGDIAFDFGLNEENDATFSYDFGIDLTHEVRDPNQWFQIHHTYSNSVTSTDSFSYDRPPVRDLSAGSSLYQTENSDWFLALDNNAAVTAGGEQSNFDPEDSSSTAAYKGEVQSRVYKLDFPDGHLENDLPTYVYEFVVPRSLFGGAETNRSFIKVRFLPTTCRNDGNSNEHVFYLQNASVDEPEPTIYGAIGNRAWFDSDNDGIQDDDENKLGIADVQVVAVSQSTGVTFTNYTDELGFYLFENVPAGYYDIYFSWSQDYNLTVYNPNLPDSEPPTTGIPERGHYVDAIISGITNVYVTAGATNLNADVGLVTSSELSTQIDICAYDSGNSILIEISTVNENGNNEIEIYAKIKGKWQLVATVPSEMIEGFGASTYTVEATGLTAEKSYKFKIIDESGHIFESQSVKVEKIKLKTVKTIFTPEFFTMTFDSDANTCYKIQYCNSLSANAGWKTEYVQIVHAAFPDGVSDYYLSVQGTPDNTTTVRIPRNHKKAFYKIVKVTE